MKKYVKPQLFYEEFELTKHIADCAWELKTPNVNTCPADADLNRIPDMAGETLFGTSACTLIPGQNYDGYCYQPGVNGQNILAS